MYTARCTRKVLEALQVPAANIDQTPSTALGDWYVNFIHTRKHRLVHFVSDRSLLSVVVPVKTLKTALDRHVLSLRDLLEALGVKPTMIRAEMAEMEQRTVATTRSKSVLASMRDLAFNARWILERTPSISPVEVSLELSQVPCGPLAMRFPAEAALAFLLERYSGTSGGARGAEPLAGADPASAARYSEGLLAGPLSSKPLGIGLRLELACGHEFGQIGIGR